MARGIRNQLLQTGKHSEGGGMPQGVDPCAALDQEPGNVPTGVADGVVKRGADRSARRLQLRATVDERDCDFYVISALCPVQGSLGAVAPGVKVRVGPRVEKQRDRGWRGREVAGPIGGNVK